MRIKFTKMQAAGNDYVYIDCRGGAKIPPPRKLAVTLSDRRYGVGGDGVILICPSETADAKMRMFNADGSEGKMCGNGVRCVGKYLYDNGVSKTRMTVETAAGVRELTLSGEGGVARGVTANMGRAELNPRSIPVNMDGASVISRPAKIGGAEYGITCVSMGNPHCAVFCDAIADLDLKTLGPKFERSSLFPDRVNAEFIRVTGRTSLEMRVWERGSGETLACGTGACAAACAAALNGYCARGSDIAVKLPGGTLVVNYTDERVTLSGECVTVFEGEYEI